MSRSTAAKAKLDDYCATFDPLFDWTITEKILRSAAFLRREVVPRREAALSIAREIEELNNGNLTSQRLVRRGLRGLLDAADISVVGETADGLEAVRLCEEQHPELMILDIAMPKLSGIEVAVETHRANLMQELNLLNTAEIVLYAVRKGLIV